MTLEAFKNARSILIFLAFCNPNLTHAHFMGDGTNGCSDIELQNGLVKINWILNKGLLDQLKFTQRHAPDYTNITEMEMEIEMDFESKDAWKVTVCCTSTCLYFQRLVSSCASKVDAHTKIKDNGTMLYD